MKITFITTMSWVPWGGSEELWSQTASRLCSQGHQVSAMVTYWPTPSPKVTAMAEAGVKVFARKCDGHYNIARRIWHKIARRLGAESEERRWLKSQKPDLVVVSQGGSIDGVEWMKYCQHVGLPYATIVQCNQSAWWSDDTVFPDVVSAYRAARKIFCVSNHNLKLLQFQLGETLNQAVVVWNPFNVPSGPPPPWPSTKDVWNLACVARLVPSAKGQDVLFEVLSQPKWRERPVMLNLYGGGQYEKSIRRLAGWLDLKNVRFHGHVQNIRNIWAENHLLVLPSRYEGLPLSLVEAMYAARPAVVTEVGGNAEMCVDGLTGFVAAAPVVGLLDEALERAWMRRDDWQDMGKAARFRVEQVVPENPVSDFCNSLLECVGSSQ